MYNPNIYNTNPYMNYGNYYNQQPQQQAMQQNLYRTSMGLQGKQIDSLDVVKATDIPLDGSISYFPLADGTAIATKQLMQDGTSKITIFKPSDEENPTQQIKYVTENDLKEQLSNFNSKDIKDIKEELKSLKKRIREITDELEEKKESCVRDDIISIVEGKLKEYNATNINPGNLENLYKLVDIHKDLKNEEYWEVKKEVLKNEIQLL